MSQKEKNKNIDLFFEKIENLKTYPTEFLQILKIIYIQQLDKQKLDKPSITSYNLRSDSEVLEGNCLLDATNFPLFPIKVTKFLLILLDLIIEQPSHLRNSAKIMKKDLTNINIKQALLAIYENNSSYFEQFKKKYKETPNFVFMMLTCAVKPFIKSFAIKLSTKLPTKFEQTKGSCPICGSLPYMTDIVRDGHRLATCSFCDYTYNVPRVSCLFCMEKDHSALRFFSMKEILGFRVAVCDTCKIYIKTTDFREFERSSLACIDDLASIHLDLRAQSEGYFRQTLTAWGF